MPADIELMRDWQEPLLLRTEFVSCHQNDVCVKFSLEFDVDFSLI